MQPVMSVFLPRQGSLLDKNMSSSEAIPAIKLMQPLWVDSFHFKRLRFLWELVCQTGGRALDCSPVSCPSRDWHDAAFADSYICTYLLLFKNEFARVSLNAFINRSEHVRHLHSHCLNAWMNAFQILIWSGNCRHLTRYVYTVMYFTSCKTRFWWAQSSEVTDRLENFFESIKK